MSRTPHHSDDALEDHPERHSEPHVRGEHAPTPTPSEPNVLAGASSRIHHDDPRPDALAQDPLRRSATSGMWIGVVVAIVVLILLIIFIAQNTESVAIQYLGWEGSVPLAVAVLAAAVAGMVITVVVGSLRILQLRRRVKREVKQARKARQAERQTAD